MNDEELEKLRRRFADLENERLHRKTVLERFGLALAIVFKGKPRKASLGVSLENGNRIEKDTPSSPSA